MGDNFSLNSVKVDAWGSVQNGNDCWWNIAKNQAGQGASASEINKIMNELIEYNAQKQEKNVTKNTALHTGEQIFIPLEYAMDEIKTGVETKVSEVTTASEAVTTAQTSLGEANKAVSSALSSYESAMSSLESIGEDGDKSSAQAAANEAKQAYLDALAAQQAAQEAFTQAQTDLETKKGELESLKTELSELQTEYAEEKDEYKEQLAELDAQIAAIDQNITNTQGELDAAKEAAEATTAQQQQDAATELGVVKGDDGKLSLEDKSSDELDKAETTSEGKVSIDDVQELVDEDTGETEYWQKNEDGEWVKINKEDIDFGDEAEDKAEEAGDKKYSLDDVDVKTMPDGSKVYLHTDENGKTTEIDPSEIDGLESSDEADDAKEAKEESEKESEEEAAMRKELAQSRAKELFEAIDGWGTDEDAVKEILNNVKGQDLLDVAAEYEAKYGESLEDAIRGDFSGKEEDKLLDKLEDAEDEVRFHEVAGKEITREEISKDSIMESQLRRFKEATDGAGTDEAALTELIQGMSKQELKEFTEYCKKQGVDIKQVIEDETSGNYEKTLTSSVDSAQNYKATKDKTEDEKRKEMANARADQLFSAVDGWGTDEDAVKEILNNVKGQDLLDVAEAYEAKYGESLEDAIRGDFSGKEEDKLLDKLEDAEDEVRFHEIAEKEVAREDYTDEKLAKERATAFYEATGARWGTDEDVIEELMSLNDDEIIAMAKALEDQGKDIITLIEKDFSGKTEKSYKEKLKRLGIE